MYWQSSSLQRTNSGLFPSNEVRRRSAMVTVSETTSQRNGLEGELLTECSPLPAFSHASRGTGQGLVAQDHRQRDRDPEGDVQTCGPVGVPGRQSGPVRGAGAG